MSTHLLGEFIRREIEARGLTEREFAARHDIPVPTLSSVINHPNSLPRLDTLDQIARGLGVPLGQLIELCGFSIGLQEQVPEMLVRTVQSDKVLQEILETVILLPSTERNMVRGYAHGLSFRK